MESHISEVLSNSVSRSAAVNGFEIYLLGNDLQKLDELHSLQTPRPNIVPAISIRGLAGARPLPRALLEKALQLSAGVQDIYQLQLLPHGSDVYGETLMLLVLLLRCGCERSRIDGRRYRFLWLEGLMEIFVGPSQDFCVFDISAHRLLELCGRLISERNPSSRKPSLRYLRIHEEQLKMAEAEWCPTGPLAQNQIVLL
jgi:hypothetical protein